MIRLLSAIGMSRYTGRKALDQFLNGIMSRSEMQGAPTAFRGRRYLSGKENHVELYHDMGPFQLIIRGRISDQNIQTFSAVPAIKEKRGYQLLDCETQEYRGDHICVLGQERSSLEPICLCMTEVYRFYRQPQLRTQRLMEVSCYGLSVEGKVLLGIERTSEDQKLIQEDEEWRRERLTRMLDGDEEATAEIREEERRAEAEIEERLHTEDVFSIFDTFLYPAEGEDNYYTLLGDIMLVEKLMNSETEEWVYYLDLDVLGQRLRVAINPRDLLGEPRPGCRFMGKVSFFGRLNPAALLLENRDAFY